MQTALLLIDVQQSFTARPYWRNDDLPAFLERCNTLLTGCAERRIPVVQVFHSDPPDTPDNPFASCSGLVRPLEGLASFAPALRFEKHRHSALVGSPLPVWLHAQGVRRLMVAGIRTEQCCETTTRHASDEGYEVDYITEATLTFPMRTPRGDTLSVQQLKERTETVLQDRFATVCTVAQALARAR